MGNRIAGRIGVLTVASVAAPATVLAVAAPASATPAGSGTITQNGSTITFAVTGVTGGPGLRCVAFADLIAASLGLNFWVQELAPSGGGNEEVSLTGVPTGRYGTYLVCGDLDGVVLVAAASPIVGSPPPPTGSNIGTSVITTTAPDTITASVSGVTRFGTAWCAVQQVQVGKPYTWKGFSETERVFALTDGAGSIVFSGLPPGRYMTRTRCARETGASYMASEVTDISASGSVEHLPPPARTGETRGVTDTPPASGSTDVGNTNLLGLIQGLFS